MLSRLKTRVIEPAPASPSAPPPRGLSLHVGVNRLDETHYRTEGALRGCEFDARDMAAMAAALGYEVLPPLLTEDATCARVIAALQAAAVTLAPGDIFLFSYSGHGAQIPDLSGDEEDRFDETLCLHDRMMVDDELQTLLAAFAAGVRVVVLTDACHSGSMTRAMLTENLLASAGPGIPWGIGPARPAVFRSLDEATARRVYRSHAGLYEGVARAVGSAPEPQANVIAFGACQDEQFAQDLEDNGLFTASLKQVWRGGASRGNYETVFRNVQGLMPPSQAPKLDLHYADKVFPKQAAFRIG